jgi:hypothetical protein
MGVRDDVIPEHEGKMSQLPLGVVGRDLAVRNPGEQCA